MVPCTKTHLLALKVPPKGFAQTLAFNQESSEAQIRKWRYHFILHCSQSPCVWQIFRLSVPFGVVSLFSWSKQMDPSCTKYLLSCFPYIALHYQQITQPRDQLRTRSSTLLFPPLWELSFTNHQPQGRKKKMLSPPFPCSYSEILG